MGFDAFDKSRIEQYKQEAKDRWGSTGAYQEYERRKQSGSIRADAGADITELFKELGAFRHLAPDDAAVQERIAALQSFITANYYTCTKEILSNLGQVYTADERFKQNIDKAGGKGTAELAGKAIEIYCR